MWQDYQYSILNFTIPWYLLWWRLIYQVKFIQYIQGLIAEYFQLLSDSRPINTYNLPKARNTLQPLNGLKFPFYWIIILWLLRFHKKRILVTSPWQSSRVESLESALYSRITQSKIWSFNGQISNFFHLDYTMIKNIPNITLRF